MKTHEAVEPCLSRRLRAVIGSSVAAPTRQAELCLDWATVKGVRASAPGLVRGTGRGRGALGGSPSQQPPTSPRTGLQVHQFSPRATEVQRWPCARSENIPEANTSNREGRARSLGPSHAGHVHSGITPSLGLTQHQAVGQTRHRPGLWGLLQERSGRNVKEGAPACGCYGDGAFQR